MSPLGGDMPSSQVATPRQDLSFWHRVASSLAMGRHLLSLLRHPATMMAIALLASAGPLGCGITGPAPDHQGDDTGTRTAGGMKPADPGPTRLVLRLGERR